MQISPKQKKKYSKTE